MFVLLAEIDWNSLLQKPDMLPLLVLVPTMGVIALAAIIVPRLLRAQQVNAEARLKERMIERGFTADEIVSVLNAGTASGRVAKCPTTPEGARPFVC